MKILRDQAGNAVLEIADGGNKAWYNVNGERVKEPSQEPPWPKADCGTERTYEFAHQSYLRARTTKRLKSEISVYSCLVETGGYLRPVSSAGACHASIGRLANVAAICTGPRTRFWDTWNFGRGSRGCEGAYENFEDREKRIFEAGCAFWDWLVSHSPWAGVFVEKPSALEAEERGVNLCVDAPKGLVCQAIIATRMPNEYPARTLVWYDLVRDGVPPTLALFVSEIYRASAETPDSVQLAVNLAHGAIHDIFDSTYCSVKSLEYLDALDMSKFKGSSTTMRSSPGMSGTHAFMSIPESDYRLGGLITELDKVKQKGCVFDLNTLKLTTASTNTIPYQKFLKTVKKWSKCYEGRNYKLKS